MISVLLLKMLRTKGGLSIKKCSFAKKKVSYLTQINWQKYIKHNFFLSFPGNVQNYVKY